MIGGWWNEPEPVKSLYCRNFQIIFELPHVNMALKKQIPFRAILKKIKLVLQLVLLCSQGTQNVKAEQIYRLH